MRLTYKVKCISSCFLFPMHQEQGEKGRKKKKGEEGGGGGGEREKEERDQGKEKE